MDDNTYLPLREPKAPPPVPNAERVMGWLPYFGLTIAIAGAVAAYLFTVFADWLPWPVL